MSEILFGAVEAGGTKVKCAIGAGPLDIRASAQFPTREPVETLRDMVAFFRAHGGGALAAFGVASFGPVRLDPAASDWGSLLNTPKRGWSGESFVEPLLSAFGRPVALDTDVNAAVLGEHRHGAARGCDVAVYLTVGTGVGGGVIVRGRTLRGLLHPEIGHIRLRRAARDVWPGLCPFHGDCLEGLASGPAIEARWGARLSDLGPDHEALAEVADYLGQACANLALVLSAQRVIIGGGASKAPGLLSAVSARMRHWLSDYLPVDALSREFIVAPALGDESAIIGGLVMAQERHRDGPAS